MGIVKTAMKKIILIGKMNKITEELNELLSGDFRVQIAADDVKILPEIIRIKTPDLILINLAGLHEGDVAFFSVLENEFPEIPVLTVGTEGERNRIKEFFHGKLPGNVLRPVTYSSIMGAVCRTIGYSGKTEEETASEGRKSSDKKKVLVVDDNGHMLRTVKAMLESEYEVELVRSGVKAMTSIGRERPDVILLDYDMPVCDGRQTLELIRSDEDLKDLPVIFLTGVNDREHIRKVLLLNPQGYLLKPITEDALISAIKKAIG